MNDLDSNSRMELSQNIELANARLMIFVNQAPVGIIAGVITSFVMFFFAVGKVEFLFLTAWFVAVFSFSLLHLFVVRYVKNKLENQLVSIHQKTNQLEQLLAVTAFISGILFGVLGAMMETEWPLILQVLVTLYIAGVAIGALASSSSSLLNYSSFIIPMLSLLAYGLFVVGQPWVALFLVVFLLVMMVTVKRVNMVLVESLSLRLDNVKLVDNLTKNNREQGRLLAKLSKSERLANGAFDSTSVAMALVDSDRKLFKANQALCKLAGFTEAELRGRRFSDLAEINVSSQAELYFIELVQNQRQQYRFEEKYQRKDGEIILVALSVTSVRNEKDEFEYAVVHAQDISQEYQLKQKLIFQAEHDSLTGLPNRYAFEKKLQELLGDGSKNEHVLCYIDLDQFKVVNDTCGHIAGDELLKQLALLLKQELNSADLLARIGGDEFAVLLFNQPIELAILQFEEILVTLRNFRYIYEGQSFNVGASIGLVQIDNTSLMIDVLKQADNACYAAKDAGRDRLHVYSHGDALLAQRSGEMEWVSRIQQALEQDELVLFYQEIVSISGSDAIPHYELLIRMRADDGSIIPPGMFLPAAERYNLAAAIDLWVVKYTIDTLNIAIAYGKNVSGVYGVNLSGQSLGDTRFYEEIIQLVRDNDFRETGAVLCFEVTETAAISNITAALRLMSELRSLGCEFALDDFGSGLSSFAYLKQMPIDYLKIDGMFVKDCLTDPVNLAMIESINGIGQVMGLRTIAEFVENGEIFNQLAQIGVDYAQGYWNGPPKPWSLDELPE